MSEAPSNRSLERIQIVAQALEEARQLHDNGAFPGAMFWQVAADQVSAIQNAGDDFEQASILARGLGRILTYELSEFPPAMERLFRAMDNWRRATKRGWE
jgi:hypothetical protein